MAWTQGCLTSSLSIVIALAACLSATTSEGRNRVGPGVTGQCLGAPAGSLGLFGCVHMGSALPGLASPCSQGSAAPGSCLLEFANPGAFAPEAKLRSRSGEPDSAAMPAALPYLPCPGCAAACRGGRRGDRDIGTSSAVAIPITSSSTGPCMLAEQCGLRWSLWVGTGRCAEDEGSWKGRSGGKLLVRERAGNF